MRINVKYPFLITYIIALFIGFDSIAQKIKNRIIIWDVTSSMVGTKCNIPPVFCYDSTSDIDKSVKIAIKKIIENSLDNSGSIRILPFTTSILDDTKVFQNNSDGRKNALNYIEQYNIPEKPNGYTNICGAWDHAMNFIDSTKDNIIYLFTDGKQNIDYDGFNKTTCLSAIISKYCNLSQNSETFTFFISLNVQDNSFSNSLNNACRKNLKYLALDSVKNKGIQIPIVLVAKNNPIIINIQDDSHSTIERFTSVNGIIPANFNFDAQLQLSQNIPFDIKYKIKSVTDNKLDVEFILDDFTNKEIEAQKENFKGESIDGIIKLNCNSEIATFNPGEILVKIINKKSQKLHFYIKD